LHCKVWLGLAHYILRALLLQLISLSFIVTV